MPARTARATNRQSQRGDLLELVEGSVRLLAIGEGGVKQRLLVACVQKLQYVKVAEVPAELVPRLVAIRERCGLDQTHDGATSVESALERMTPSAAVVLAGDLFDFNALLARAAYH